MREIVSEIRIHRYNRNAESLGTILTQTYYELCNDIDLRDRWLRMRIIVLFRNPDIELHDAEFQVAIY